MHWIEGAKRALVAGSAFLAGVLGSDRPWPRRLAAALVVAALPIALVVTQPDLSTAAVLRALTATMLVLGRIPLKVLVVFLVAAPGGLAGIWRRVRAYVLAWPLAR